MAWDIRWDRDDDEECGFDRVRYMKYRMGVRELPCNLGAFDFESDAFDPEAEQASWELLSGEDKQELQDIVDSDYTEDDDW